jgi:hypothetical protein
VTDSLGEVRVALAAVAEHIGSAYQYAGVARARIAESVAVLTRLSEQHPDSLVPVELLRAADELDRGLGLISGGGVVVSDIEARL